MNSTSDVHEENEKRNTSLNTSSDVNTAEPEDAEKQPSVTPAADVPPNGGYGWVCVACCFLLNAHTWGLNSAYAVFLAYYLKNDAFPGSSPLEFAFVGGLSISMAMLISPVATTLVRIRGTRVTILLGVLFETASFIGASFASKIWHLFLSQGVCFGFGMGLIFVASVSVPPQWFTTKRSLANATSAAGSGLGGLIYSLATNTAIKSVGLPWAFRILGIIAFAVNTTCALLVRDRNLQIGSVVLAFDLTLFRRFEYNLMQAWGFFSMLGYVVLLFSLPNFGASIGLTAHQGSVVSAIFQLGQMLGRPPIGFFSDSFGRINMAATMTFLAGLFSLVIWIFAKSYGVLIFFALVGGAVAGTFWATIAPVGAEVCGLKALPSALSLTWLVLVLPTTFSEPIALEIAERSSARYLGTQLFAGFMYIAAALCLWCVRVWKIGEVDRAEFAKMDNSSDTEWPPPKSSLLKRTFAWRKV